MSRISARIDFFYRVALLILRLKNKGIDVMPFSFYRSPEEQKRLFKEGKTLTLNSKHMYYLAIDLVVVKNGKLVWERTNDYEILGNEAESLGLVWGGRWKDLNDIYHVEYPGSIPSA